MKTNLKIRLSFLLIPLAALLLNGCQKKEEPSSVVVLEPTQSQPLKIGEPKQIIKLETSKESQLGYIYKTATDKVNNRIFVLSDFNLFIFDGEGNFIRKLHQGKGPGEISMVVSFSLNPSNKLFYVLDNGRRICVFDYDGKLVEDHVLSDFYSMAIQSIDARNVFLLCNWVGGKEDKFVGIYNFDENKVIRKLIPASESSYSKLVMILHNRFMNNGERMFFSGSNIWSLFEWKNNQFEKVLLFDTGNRRVPTSFSEKYLARQKRRSFKRDAENRGYVPFLYYSFYFKGYYWAIIGDEEKSCYAIDENNYNKVYMDGPVSAYFGLPEVKSLRYPREMTQKYMVFACSPADFFEADDTATTKTITIGDKQVQVDMNENPFLIVAE